VGLVSLLHIILYGPKPTSGGLFSLVVGNSLLQQQAYLIHGHGVHRAASLRLASPLDPHPAASSSAALRFPLLTRRRRFQEALLGIPCAYPLGAHPALGRRALLSPLKPGGYSMYNPAVH
jgi:hypothetical protein